MRSEHTVGAPIGRRVVLGLLLLGGAGVVTGRAAQDGFARLITPLESADPTGLLAMLPSGENFRFYSVTGRVRRADPLTYRLAVGGLVAKPVSYSLTTLGAMPQVSLVRDFQCVTGWRVPKVPWQGVSLARLIDASEPMPSATAVRFTSFDGTYSESLSLDQARRADVIVALRMLGKPVTHNHGGPVRMYVAPMYGYKSIKWLSSIELTAGVEPGYWEHNGYDVDGWIGRSNGRDDAPVG